MTSVCGVFVVPTIGFWTLARLILVIVALLPVVQPLPVDAADTDLLKPVVVDAERLRASGLREISGKHLSLYTDLPSSPAVDELPRVFDAAVPQWAAYFKVAPARVADWRMHAFLMKDKAKFVRAGVYPAFLPDFKNGFCADADLWLYDQPSDYYRRHLLLHEGTHGFMLTLLGGTGAAWFTEGVAEALATHRWDPTAPAGRQLELGVIPRRREEFPALGRIALIKADLKADKEDLNAGRFRGIGDLVDDSVRGYTDVESYAWCWALVMFLDRHPRYRDRFRELFDHVRSPTFNEEYRKRFTDDIGELSREWSIFVHELEHGVDVPRTAIERRPIAPLDSSGAKIDVAADRGWQSSGLKLEAGKRYRVRASGRYQIASVDGKPWQSEPGGITIRYYRGRPLGLLLGAIDWARPNIGMANTKPAMLQPVDLGLDTEITPQHSGTLYLRVNDSNGELDDNAGKLSVEVLPLP